MTDSQPSQTPSQTPSLDPYAQLTPDEEAAADEVQADIPAESVSQAEADDANWRKHRAAMKPVTPPRNPRQPSPDDAA